MKSVLLLSCLRCWYTIFDQLRFSSLFWSYLLIEYLLCASLMVASRTLPSLLRCRRIWSSLLFADGTLPYDHLYYLVSPSLILYDIAISSTLHIESKWSLANRRQVILPSRIVLSSDWLVSWSVIKLWLVSLYHSCCEKYFSLFQYCFKLTWFLGNHREPIAAQLT